MESKKQGTFYFVKKCGVKRMKGDIIEKYKLLLKGNIRSFGKYVWDGEEGKKNAVLCLRYLIEKVLKWDDNEIREKYSKKILAQYKLYGALNSIYDGNIFRMLEDAYPKRFEVWEFNNVSKNYWNKETARKAIRGRHFEENGLLGMLIK